MKMDTYREYRFLRVIGEGAFSRVYLAEDESGQQYACKVSREVKMLEREAELMSRLFHPLFPAYVDYEEREGVGRLFMEYIPGRSLGQMARLRGGFSPRQAMRIAEELADGMRYLHERQPAVLYRDLKPENVMVCENGHIKIIDFGCACCQDIQWGVKVGTPGFAPPEQLTAGEAVGTYSDIYGLGKTIQNIMANKKTGSDVRNMYYSMKGDTGRGENVCGREESVCDEGKSVCGMGKSVCGRGKNVCGGGERKVRNGRRKKYSEGRRRYLEEKSCRQRLERMIEEATRDDFRQRPQDMISMSYILDGKRGQEEGIICEKNIWESSYKNSCSLPLI